MTQEVRCLVSAGPTREYLDPVRFLSNPSTGRMGYAIAEAAVELGWTVDLVSGPSPLPEPEGPVFYPVETGEEMYHQLDALFGAADILVMTAAVTDFRPSEFSGSKVKKKDAATTVHFEPVIDILATLARRRHPAQVLVGFAAETDQIEDYARSKLEEKDLDLIVANRIGEPGAGFGSVTNRVAVIDRKGSIRTIGPDSKRRIGQELVRIFAETLETRRRTHSAPC